MNIATRGWAHLIVGLLLCVLSASCGDSSQPAPTEAVGAPNDGWQRYRDLQPGDCITSPHEFRLKVPCEGDAWYARIYDIIRDDEFNKRPCATPPTGVQTSVLDIPDPPFVTLCMALREPFKPD